MRIVSMPRAAVLAATLLLAAQASASLEGVSARSQLPSDPAATLDAALSAATVDRAFAHAGFRIGAVRRGDSPVPRLFVNAMPRDMGQIDPPAERKRIFITLMLPLVLDAGERTAAARERLARLKAILGDGGTITARDRHWLNGLAALHHVDDLDLDELLNRVNVVPVSLALAQAALESGWGTSRFAHEGNAVFGQRSWNQDEGLVPQERHPLKSHVVKSFNGLRESVLAYVVNLNRHPAYEHMREIRAELEAQGRPLDGWVLAAGLDDYAEEQDYVDYLRSVIRHNGLTDFDNARLDDAGRSPAPVILSAYP